MRIYRLRHADAESIRTSDAARELTDYGVGQARAVGAFCVARQIAPSVILTSPYRRTRQTAEQVGEAVEVAPQNAAFLASGMTPETALLELSAYQRLEEVMLVGHQPDLSLLAASLLGVENAESVDFGKAALMSIETSRVAPGAGCLRFFVPPPWM